MAVMSKDYQLFTIWTLHSMKELPVKSFVSFIKDISAQNTSGTFLISKLPDIKLYREKKTFVILLETTTQAQS